MTKFGRPTVPLLLAASAFAQIPGAEWHSNVAGMRYPPLAATAQVQGDVHLRFRSGTLSVLSGHPLLVEAAIQNTKMLGALPVGTDVDLVYHFILVVATTSVPIPVNVKRGNAFQRAVLRIFGRKTEKVVVEYQCQEGSPPASHLDGSATNIEVWVYGGTHCLQTQAATLVAQR
jgi:hypothetical protein